MPYALRKLPKAEAEADGAAAWYERHKPGLGFEFLDRLDDTVAVIVQNPFRYGLRFGDVRRALISKSESLILRALALGGSSSALISSILNRAGIYLKCLAPMEIVQCFLGAQIKVARGKLP